jgi:toxin ParE1/3/4
MSFRKRHLILLPEAQQDIRDILLYTSRHWGQQQVRVYRSKLDNAVRGLIRYPYRGRPRDDVSIGLRGREVESHVVFYRITDETIYVLRILHQKMDATTHIDP